MDQFTKEEMFRDGAVISNDVHTCSPLHKLYFYYFYIQIFICIYISRPIYRGKQKFISLQTSYLTLYTLYNI